MAESESVRRRRLARKALGLLKGKIPYEPFDRHKEGLYPSKRDRT